MPPSIVPEPVRFTGPLIPTSVRVWLVLFRTPPIPKVPPFEHSSVPLLLHGVLVPTVIVCPARSASIVPSLTMLSCG